MATVMASAINGEATVIAREGCELVSSDYSAIDVMHDVYGIEVLGIRKEEDADAILDVLRNLFPSWKICRTYYKDQGRDPGFWVTIQRDHDARDQQWEIA